MNTKLQKLAKAIIVSSTVAIATPALAAGLVAGTAGAVTVVADAGPIAHRATVESGTTATDTAPAQDVTATGGPRRLSTLAGSDDQAWASARDVHVRAPVRSK